MGRGKGDSHFLMDVALPSAHKVISFPSAHKDKVISLPSAHVSQKVKATFFTLSNASLTPPPPLPSDIIYGRPLTNQGRS